VLLKLLLFVALLTPVIKSITANAPIKNPQSNFMTGLGSSSPLDIIIEIQKAAESAEVTSHEKRLIITTILTKYQHGILLRA